MGTGDCHPPLKWQATVNRPYGTEQKHIPVLDMLSITLREAESFPLSSLPDERNIFLGYESRVRSRGGTITR